MITLILGVECIRCLSETKLSEIKIMTSQNYMLRGVYNSPGNKLISVFSENMKDMKDCSKFFKLIN